MEILPGEIESIKTIGNLHGDEVKMVKTVGGFYVAVGKKKKTARKAEAIAAGSHAALVSHQLQKEYGSDFEPAIFKSEQDQLPKVESKTEYLSSEAIDHGIELFTLCKNNTIDFVLYKRGLTLGQYSTEIEDNSLVIKSQNFEKESIVDSKKTANAFSRAIKDKVHELKLKGVKKALGTK